MVEIDTKAQYGYFEHDKTGSGGGLCLEDNELTDYDGVACLPKAIVSALREHGFILDEAFD